MATQKPLTFIYVLPNQYFPGQLPDHEDDYIIYDQQGRRRFIIDTPPYYTISQLSGGLPLPLKLNLSELPTVAELRTRFLQTTKKQLPVWSKYVTMNGNPLDYPSDAEIRANSADPNPKPPDLEPLQEGEAYFPADAPPKDKHWRLLGYSSNQGGHPPEYIRRGLLLYHWETVEDLEHKPLVAEDDELTKWFKGMFSGVGTTLEVAAVVAVGVGALVVANEVKGVFR